MRKLLILAAILLLTGCAAEPVYETISDGGEEMIAVGAPGIMDLVLPENTDMEVLADGSGQVYMTGDKEIRTQILPAGDLTATFRAVTGLGEGRVTPVSIPGVRYEAAWTTAAEQGLMAARTAVWDDGLYHYCLTLLAPEESGAGLDSDFRELADSLTIRYTEP